MFFREIARQVKRPPAKPAFKLKRQNFDIFQISVMAQSRNSDFAMAVWTGENESVRVLHETPDNYLASNTTTARASNTTTARMSRLKAVLSRRTTYLRIESPVRAAREGVMRASLLPSLSPGQVNSQSVHAIWREPTRRSLQRTCKQSR